MKSLHTASAIEPLEARIAPAKLLSLIDADGDLISITTTKGTDAELLAAVITFVPTGAVPGGVQIATINLQGNAAAFDGTSLSVTAKRGPLGGDGLVNVVTIQALGLDLGKVSVKGDLSVLTAGKSDDTIAAISVHSTTGNSSWNIIGSVGSLTVKTDVLGTNIGIAGASLGKLTIGGSLRGLDTSVTSGIVQVPDGVIGKVIIGGSIVGTDQDETGQLLAKSIGSVVVGGSLRGGDGRDSALIRTTDTAGSLGSITVKGDVSGGGGTGSGRIRGDGTLGSATIGGSVLGGGKSFSGAISGIMGIGKVTIGHDLAGGTGPDSGRITSSGGGIDRISIGGSMIGGTGFNSGLILASGGDIGSITIRGDLQAGAVGSGGVVPSDSGVIIAKKGTAADTEIASIASITIGGSVIGRGPATDAQIFADGNIGAVKIAGDLRGGTGMGSGEIYGRTTLGLVTVGGSVDGGAGENSGSIQSRGKIAGVKITGSLVGGEAGLSGAISTRVAVGPITIGGDLVGGLGGLAGVIVSDGILDAVTIRGNVLADGGPAGIYVSNFLRLSGTDLSLKSLTIGGSATQLVVVANGEDDIIGPVKVGGDWREGSIRVAAFPGADTVFGTNDDTSFGPGDSLNFTKITSITIGGAVIGTFNSANSNDHFGFVAQEIGALKIAGTKIPLLPGHGNDADATLSRYKISLTRDFTVHEVA